MPSARQRSEKATPQEWYAASDLFDETRETTATPIPRTELVPKTAVAVPRATAHPQSGNGKTRPSLTMLAAYGESEATAPPEWPRRHGLLVGLLLLVFFGMLGFGGWYLLTHRASVQQPQTPIESSTAPVAIDSSTSSSSTSTSRSTSRQTTSSNTADDDFRRLREKRIGAKPSETSEIIAAFEDAENRYPTDYRFPYERAKLSIKGITSHHEAFGALALAAEKAIDNGKAQEMLDSLMTDKDGDFYKLARGHREWQMLAQALSSKDKRELIELRH